MKHFYLLLTFLLFSTAFSNAQIVNIPDANFKNALLANSNINLNNDNEIQVSEAEIINSLELSSLAISDLTGIEAFTFLQYLDIDINQISVLDLSQNILLSYLQCSYNSLNNLDLSQNTMLLTLNCDNNPLTSINLSQNIRLYKIKIYNAQLTTLDLTNNLNMRDLVCFNNNLTSLDLSQNPDLRILRCENNQISSFDFSSNLDLMELSISGNPTGNVDFSNNINLEDLRLSRTNITDLDITNNLYLYFLDVRTLSISSLDLSQNSDLRIFDCTGSMLESLDFSNNPNLHLMVTDNSINLNCVNLTNNASPDYYYHDYMFTSHSGATVGSGSFFSALNCPNLNFIIVDDISVAENTFLYVSPNTNFSNDVAACDALRIDKTDVLNSLIIYPNPVTNILNINLNHGILLKKISLLNLTGQELFNDVSGREYFDLTNYPSGVYFVKIETNKGVVNKRIIKN